MHQEATQAAALKPTLETKESLLLHIYPNRVEPAYNNPSKHTCLKGKKKERILRRIKKNRILSSIKIERE